MKVPNSLKSAVVVGLFLPSVCEAYVDPNTGGYVFQFLFPVFVAVGAAWCMLKEKVSRKIGRLLQKSKPGVEE